MCGRFTNRYTWRELHALYSIHDDRPAPNWPARYNIAPTQDVPVVRLIEGRRRIDMLRWGLIPSWAKDSKIGNSCINARGEEAYRKPAFRSAFKARRCVVPADGFYEWKTERGAKQPYHVSLAVRFGFAALWESWTAKAAERNIEAGHVVETFTIITTAAGPALRDLHDREPVMLQQHQFEAWLDPASETETLRAMLKSVPAELVDVRPASRLVNNVRNDSADLLISA